MRLPCGASKYGLYYAVNYGNKEELLDGINNLQIRYGVNSAGHGVDNYLPGSQVTAGNLWEKVNSVILTVTPDSAALGSQINTWEIYIKLRER